MAGLKYHADILSYSGSNVAVNALHCAQRFVLERLVFLPFEGGYILLLVKNMLKLLRLVSLVLGCAITVAPIFLTLAFAYGVGEPPETTAAYAFYLLPLGIGLIFGVGPLLIGFPKLVAGTTRPRIRVVAGAFLAISMAGLLIVGFGGSVTRVVTPIALLGEFVLFAVFIWPAKHFPANPEVNTDAGR